MSYLTREHYNETCQALVKGPLVLFALSFVFKKKNKKNKKKTRKNKKEENENDRKPKKFEKHAKDNSVSL